MTESSPDSSEVEQLIDALREQLLAEDGEEAAEVARIGQVRDVMLSEPATLVVDELMTGTMDIADDLRSRLISKVDRRLAQRRRRAGRLEPLLKASRLAQDLSVDEVSGLVEVDASQFRKLEDGLLGLTDQDEVLIGRWIIALGEDDGAALNALARSIGSPPVRDRAYAGQQEANISKDNDFVRRVAEAIEQLRATGGIGRPDPPS